MALRNLVTGWTTTSISGKLIIGVALFVALLAVGYGGSVIGGHFTDKAYQKRQEALKEENQRITDAYWEAIGERNALRIQAQQSKLEADAYRQAGEQRGANVKALDEKIDAVRGQYDEIQSSLGDCSSFDDCRKQLCAKYKQAGIRLKNCPD